ncbi:hypothetical protein BJ742DRAFT_766814 [Cladochytrium replicatum]|nr:hypothetical protein BJ742DRAFT_766814 [Cladochytrium replicatum]
MSLPIEIIDELLILLGRHTKNRHQAFKLEAFFRRRTVQITLLPLVRIPSMEEARTQAQVSVLDIHLSLRQWARSKIHELGHELGELVRTHWGTRAVEIKRSRIQARLLGHGSRESRRAWGRFGMVAIERRWSSYAMGLTSATGRVGGAAMVE